MKKQLLMLALPVLLLAGCKKNFTCACGNMNTDVKDRAPVFEVKDTRKKAKQKCLDYQNSQTAIPEWMCDIR